MRKLLIIVSLLIVASMVLAACKPAPTPAPAEPTAAPVKTEAPAAPTAAPKVELPDLGGREVTIAIENAYLPFNYVDLATGEAQGWDYDFINHACELLNCVPVWQEFGWDTMIAAVADGQFDMAADGITITADRAKQVDFSDGYVAIEQRLLVRADETRFTNGDEFKADPSLILGEQIGTTNYQTAADLVGDSRVQTFDDFGVTVQALLSGDVDGVIIDETAGLGYLGANKDQLKLVGPSLSSDQLGFIFPKGSDLVAPFNAAIAAMKGDGSLQEMNMKWFGPSFTLTYDDVGGGVYDLGKQANPIKVLFVPSVDTGVIVTGGQIMADALHEATGLYFDVSVPTSYAATIEEMCANPDSTMGFIPGLGYALANQLCGVDVAFKAIRYGFPVYFAQFLVARDSDIQTFADLDGKTWGYPDAGSTSGYMVPMTMFKDAGITPGDTVETGGHTAAVKAVYNGEVDFATTYYSVPLSPESGGGPWWTYDDWKAGNVTADMYDIPADVVPTCALNDAGKLYCGEWRPLDARPNIRTESPDVIQKVRILAVSPAIPNDTLSFGPDFPADLRAQIEDALIAFSQTDAWAQSIGNNDFYGWTGIQPATDEEYDFIRQMVEAVGITLENLGK